MKFPQYRKYKNGRSYFKIENELNFVELKLHGESVEFYTIEAKILPDRNYIHDMLYNYEMNWKKIDKDEFEAFRAKYSDGWNFAHPSIQLNLDHDLTNLYFI